MPTNSAAFRRVRAGAPVLERLEDRRLLAGDAVLEWNSVLLDAVRVDKTAPPLAARDMAMVQCAVHDAVNAVVGGDAGFLVHRRASRQTSVPVAVAKAAHDVLVALFPAQAKTFDAKLATSLAGTRAGGARNSGIALGRECANAMLRARRNDGAAEAATYTSLNGPGDWQPTPPAFTTDPLLAQWPAVKPFAISSGSAFRSARPPALGSAAYTAAYEEVASLGAVDSTRRTADQTQIAKFWADGAGTATPPGHWNQIAQSVAEAQHNSIAENARLFAVLDIALADAGIAAWDAKYAFNLWRPVTAIRAGDADGNPATTADPAWTPLLVTPPFPSYVSGHSAFSAAAATILADFYGTDHIAFTSEDDTVPGLTRSFKSFSQAAAEAGQSRIYGGIHWQFDNQAGLAVGRKVGSQVFARVLVPVAGQRDCPPSIAVHVAFGASAKARAFSTVRITDRFSARG